MKKKKAGRLIILAAFAVICMFRGIWFFAEKHMDTTNYEKRELAEKPKFSFSGYGTYSDDYTSYFNDHLPFRNNLILLNSMIDYYCFGTSSSENVVVGKDDWLFYSRVDDGDPLSSYQGKNLYTEEELAQIADNCLAQRDIVEAQGSEFVIFIAPNKERIYPEYMPNSYGEPSVNYPALQVYSYLKKNTDLRVVYPYDDLMSAKESIDQNLYYKTDTHWNTVGGYVGSRALLKELGISLPSIDSKKITIQQKDEVAGDLADTLHLSKQLLSADHEYSVEGYDLNDREELEWSFQEMIQYRASHADSRVFYVIRDSFCTQMAPYLGSQFNESYFRYLGSYTYEDLVSHNPDIVVFEVVERYVGTLGSFSIY